VLGIVELDFKRPRRGLGILIGSINGVLVLYAAAWIAGVGDLRRLTDWRGPVAAVVLAIVLGAAILIQQIQALE
jgi:hypothetical protein